MEALAPGVRKVHQARYVGENDLAGRVPADKEQVKIIINVQSSTPNEGVIQGKSDFGTDSHSGGRRGAGGSPSRQSGGRWEKSGLMALAGEIRLEKEVLMEAPSRRSMV